MSVTGFTGLSYPFRITSQGGTAMSTTNQSDSTHIDESIYQILGTYESERPMEMEIFSNLDTSLFEPVDEGMQAILRSIIVEDLERLEDRISVSEDDIEFSVEEDSGGVEYLYVTITYMILKYNTYTTSQFKLGEVQ